ncbi:Firmicu-CTERM sorting domain-containing protein [Weissella koreensis]|uniref:Firmicu-CTERM sorting domain-containing protein n=2 Tax=Weissella koreensis TaxID=165096 RepID=A0A7H1MKW0_9LACO|nr:Firmicu-CTERM sorting domain-containing protein [Weissella koreensis]AEJ23252.1 hypothetical protein WKK_01880 [Weissella koreensis KACC 15510]EJF33855.1 hypothetical protein JC2156_06690 [Weissella koreensis KCTC 3621]AVH74894.1 Firmicu-CTERM sorting domain-containing protein [Weissella koreensis]QGN20117.1 Firmicu-CTERM sorting domain-containing protein [Weissella koreensis]QNT64096.1 Firmicu-CTERM sorting domain-containing protein [Weissella koreensis]
MIKRIYMIMVVILTSLIFTNMKTAHADEINYDSIPMTQISYSDSTIHTWGMIVQDNAIYLNYNNDPKGQGTTTFQGYGFNFKLGDQQAVMNIDSSDSGNIPTKLGDTRSIKFQTNNYSSNIQEKITGTILVSDNGNSDKPAQILHIKIPMSTLVKDPSLVNKVELNNPNLGGGTLVSDGASTSPVLSVSIAVIAVLVIGFFVYRKKRRVA